MVVRRGGGRIRRKNEVSGSGGLEKMVRQELLAIKSRKHFDELNTTICIGVNLVNVPKVLGGTGRASVRGDHHKAYDNCQQNEDSWCQPNHW